MSRQRITRKDLEAAAAMLNSMTGNPEHPYRQEGPRFIANVGNYHISGAYGGFALHQMANDGGGVRDVLHSGHIPARELLDRIHAYRYGIEAVEQANKRIRALEQDKLSLMRDILEPLAV